MAVRPERYNFLLPERQAFLLPEREAGCAGEAIIGKGYEMTQRWIAMILAVVFLIALITYSQYRPQPNCVSGFVEADEVRLGSRVGGRVEAVRVEEGERVTKGQVLVKLEPFDLLQREQEALRTLAARDAAYRRFAGGLRPEEIAQAKARTSSERDSICSKRGLANKRSKWHAVDFRSPRPN
jgi:multidrug efflux pump subunit AcrA (membrane-fusion protein)